MVILGYWSPQSCGMAKHAQMGGKTVWYVMQVRAGTEEKVKSQCLKLIDSEVLEQCFVPYYEEKKRYRGAWHAEKRLLFPGYVFVVSSQLTELYKSLRRVEGMTKLLGTGEEIVPLTEEEIGWLKKTGANEKLVEISIGIIEGGNVMVTEGPLIGMEGCIRKIDRHKRKAWLEVNMFGRMIEMEAGLEIIMRK